MTNDLRWPKPGEIITDAFKPEHVGEMVELMPPPKDFVKGYYQIVSVNGVSAEKALPEKKRYLFYHPESDCVFEAFDEKDVKTSFEEGCDDVTGNERFEERFQKERS